MPAVRWKEEICQIELVGVLEKCGHSFAPLGSQRQQGGSWDLKTSSLFVFVFVLFVGVIDLQFYADCS